MPARATTIFWKRQARLSRPCRRLLDKKISPAWSLTCSMTKKRVLKRPLSTLRIGAELRQSLLRQTKHHGRTGQGLHPRPRRKSRIQSSSVEFNSPCDTPESHCL